MSLLEITHCSFHNVRLWHTADVHTFKCVQSGFAGDGQVIFKLSPSKIQMGSQAR